MLTLKQHGAMMKYFEETRRMLMVAAEASLTELNRERWLARARLIDHYAAMGPKDRAKHRAALRRSCEDWRDRMSNQ
jgi:hypothetical protein